MKIVLEEVQKRCAEELEKVKDNVYYFPKVLYQSEEMCLLAVKKHPEFLRDVEHQTLAICVEAVKKDPGAIYDVELHLLNDVLHELNMIYLPKGKYNGPLLLQKQPDGTYLAKIYACYIARNGVSIEMVLETLKFQPEDEELERMHGVSIADWNLGIQIQHHFLKQHHII